MSVTETVNGSHLFVIKGYSLAKGIGIGKYIAGENFTVGGHQWAIYFYPDGKNLEDNSTYVSLFIALASEGTDVRALFELTLVDQSGKGKHKVHSHFDRSLESGPYTLRHTGNMWGYKRFFRRNMLETSDYLKDDCLRIICTVGVVVSGIESSISPSLTVPDSSDTGESSLQDKKLVTLQHNRHPLLSPTSSMSVTETVNGSHLFVFPGYSLSKGIGIGKYIASENFSVGGYQWAIHFYPDGKNQEDNSTYVSVFIALESEGTDVRALFELALVDQSGKGKHKVHSHFDRSLESGPYGMQYRGSKWGYKQFFRGDMLETSDYLKDDCLQISCTVGVVVSGIENLAFERGSENSIDHLRVGLMACNIVEASGDTSGSSDEIC